MKNRMAENIALVLVFWPVLALADAPEVTPYRPTVSNPAALSTPGLFEFEAGAARFRDDAHNRRDSLPYLILGLAHSLNQKNDETTVFAGFAILFAR